MRIRVGLVVMALSLLALSGPSFAVNIVLNGDFETPDIGLTLFVPLFNGSTFLTDWTVEAPSPGQGIDIISNRTGACPGCANTGEQAIDMAGTPGRGSIFQDLTTTPSTTYDLSFFASSNGGAKINGLSIEWGGVVIDTITTPALNTWLLFSYDNLPATSNTTRLKFIGNLDGFEGSFLDTINVEAVVTAIPEPASIVLLFSGLLTLLGVRKVYAHWPGRR